MPHQRNEYPMSETSPVVGLQLGNTFYDRLKFLVQIILPALGALYASLGQIWGFPNVEQVVGSTAALALFFGLLLGLSSRNFASEATTITPVGNFVIKELESGKKTITLDLTQDPADFIDQGVIAFHAVTELPQVVLEDSRDENSH